MFSAGNTFQILNLKTKEQVNIRSTSGGGIGALAVSPVNTFSSAWNNNYSATWYIWTYNNVFKGSTWTSIIRKEYKEQRKKSVYSNHWVFKSSDNK